MGELSPELKKKMLRRKKKLKEKQEGFSFVFIKANTTIRVRALPVGADQEPGMEVVSFYIGKSRIISPASFGEKCALVRYHDKLKASEDEDDKELASKLKPKQMFVIPVIKYTDLKGKEVDKKTGVKLMLLNPGQYQEIVNHFLDSDWGDPTDVKNGYDFKMTREGSTQFDTRYSMIPAPKGPTPKEYRAEINLEEMVRKEAKDYKATKSLLRGFLGKSELNDSDDASEAIEKKNRMMKKKRSSDL